MLQKSMPDKGMPVMNDDFISISHWFFYPRNEAKNKVQNSNFKFFLFIVTSL